MRARRFLISLTVIALLIVLSARIPGWTSTNAAADATALVTPSSGPVLATEETALEGDVNQLRVANSLPPLGVDPGLTSIARSRSLDQVTQHYFSHTNPQGQTVFSLLDAANVPWTTAGENLAESIGMDPVQAAIDGWSKSPGHRENMLSSDFGRMGIGAAQAPDGTTIFTAVFTN